jgi:NAD+ synthase
MLYHYANINNLMVVGAANRTELLTGTFSQWGCDQCADVMPIVHLYRSQVEALAEYLKVPESVRNKPADPDIIPGLADKEEFLGSFSTADQILWGLESGIPTDALKQQFGETEVTRIVSLVDGSRFMRQSPATLETLNTP